MRIGLGLLLAACVGPVPPGADPAARSTPDASDTPRIPPLRAERCNGVDDDGDGRVDEHAVDRASYWRDADSDGFGNGSVRTYGCPSPGWVDNDDDCQDRYAWINPDAEEVCGNVLDEDCSGRVDDDGAVGCTLGYEDLDGDGVGGPAEPVCRCEWASPYAPTTGDCDDADADLQADCSAGSEFVPVATATLTATEVDFEELVELGGDAGTVVVVRDVGADGGARWVVPVPEVDTTVEASALGTFAWDASYLGLSGRDASPAAAFVEGDEDAYTFTVLPDALGQPETTSSHSIERYEGVNGQDLVGDVDGDGGDDLLFCQAGATEGAYLWEVPLDGEPPVLWASTTAFDFDALRRLDDLDGDGIAELYLSGAIYPGPVGEGMDLLAYDRAIVWGDPRDSADVDGDGAAELLMLIERGAAVVPGDADGDARALYTALVGTEEDGDRFDVAELKDLDGDGRAELVLAGAVGDRYGSYVQSGPIAGVIDATQVTGRWYTARADGAVVAGVDDGLLVEHWGDATTSWRLERVLLPW